MDPHRTLGVSSTASDAELRTAYKRAVLRWHPDRNRGNVEEAERKIREVGGETGQHEHLPQVTLGAEKMSIFSLTIMIVFMSICSVAWTFR